jgi:hypothetical protein
MTLAGAFFSNRARTSAHTAFVTLTGILGDFIKDLERDGPYGDSLFLQTPKKSKQKNARPKRPAPR